MTRSEPLFKKENSLEKRSTESTRILLKYKNRVPIIIDVADSFKDQLKLDKKKYLVPSDLNVSQFLYVIRKRLELQPEHALFIFFNNGDNSNNGDTPLRYALYNLKFLKQFIILLIFFIQT